MDGVAATHVSPCGTRRPMAPGVCALSLSVFLAACVECEPEPWEKATGWSFSSCSAATPAAGATARGQKAPTSRRHERQPVNKRAGINEKVVRFFFFVVLFRLFSFIL